MSIYPPFKLEFLITPTDITLERKDGGCDYFFAFSISFIIGCIYMGKVDRCQATVYIPQYFEFQAI